MSPSPPVADQTALALVQDPGPVVLTGPSFENFRDLIKMLRDEYDAADAITQKSQRFFAMAGIPAINELRYAGHHLLIGISPRIGAEDSTLELRRAINHCKRASYDASEAAILFAFDKIETFKNDFKDVVISDVLSDWSSIRARCNEVRDALTVARAKGEDRFQDHAQTGLMFDELVSVCRRLDGARDDLNTKLAYTITEARRFTWNMAFAMVGVVLAVAAIVVTLLVA